MALLTWTETFAVKVRLFDQQHRRLFDLINTLHSAMLQGRSSEVIEPVLLELIKYTEEHFAAEESAMRQLAYPSYATHRSEHTSLTAKVQAFAADYKAHKAVLSIELMDFLRNWLEKHIRGTDQQYTAFFHQKGLA